MNEYPYGGELTRNEKVAISTASGIVSVAHERKEIVITNNASAAQIAAGHLYFTLSVGVEAVDGAGIILFPGMSWYGSANSEFRVTSENIYAIANGGAADLAVFER